MDDDIVSLIGLMFIVNPSYRDDFRYNYVSQLPLSMYLIIQCQMKLHEHPMTLLAYRTKYGEIALRDLHKDRILDQLLLKLTQRKVLLYVNTELAMMGLL